MYYNNNMAKLKTTKEQKTKQKTLEQKMEIVLNEFGDSLKKQGLEVRIVLKFPKITFIVKLLLKLINKAGGKIDMEFKEVK
jgi:hypothetical protein